jgi:hypothetical protein
VEHKVAARHNKVPLKVAVVDNHQQSELRSKTKTL